MKKLTVYRDKSFVGCAIPYWVIVSKKDSFIDKYYSDIRNGLFMRLISTKMDIAKLDRYGIRLSIGQAVELELEDTAEAMFVITANGGISNEIVLDEFLPLGKDKFAIISKRKVELKPV
ncbi:hypothetical protein [Butyrivibrio sp. MC2021]|uniref:hypothetical protein n=1 Tax=Butyrivibrio sp. MC2021 TaxID=1408306 RepID=UPI000479010D|nr:hypothetical protein [Butyrivibrio sp. MC2021]